MCSVFLLTITTTQAVANIAETRIWALGLDFRDSVHPRGMNQAIWQNSTVVIAPSFRNNWMDSAAQKTNYAKGKKAHVFSSLCAYS